MGFKKRKAPRVSSLLQQLDQEKWAWHAFPGSATPMFPRQLLKAIIVMHVNELKSFKKIEIDDQKKNLNEKKKKFRVNVQDRSLKKPKQTTATKKQKTVYSSERFRKSLRSFNEKKKERKEITTSDSRAAISSSAPPK